MPPPSLFTLADAQAAPIDIRARVGRLSSGPATEAVHLVRVTPARHHVALGAQVALELAPDHEFIALVDDLARGGAAWTAQVYVKGAAPTGEPIGEATFVEGTLGLTGSVSTPELLYQVYGLGDGYHAIVARRWDEMPPDEPEGVYDEAPTDSTTLELPPPCAIGDLNCEPPGGGGGGGGGNPPTEYTVRVLVAYTPAVGNEVADVEALAALAEYETNDSFVRSGVTNLRIEVVDVVQINFNEGSISQDRYAIADPDDGKGDEVHGLRDAALADVVVLLTSQYAYPGACGVARNIGVPAAEAFAIVNHTCATGYYSFGHEIGHLFGARHNLEHDPTLTPYAYGHGYTRTGHWRTIMAYSLQGEPRIRNWSNPDIQYNGHPTGTTERANNKRVLRERAAAVAAFRPEPTDPLAISITGPTAVEAGQTRTWSLYVHAVTSPYTIEWRKGPDPASLGPVEDTDLYFTTTLTADTYIEVNVSDAAGDQATAGIFVDVTQPICQGKWCIADSTGTDGHGDLAGNAPDTASDVLERSTFPVAFALESVAPNPVRSAATLHFSLDREAHTQLVVYDVLGREVVRLVDEPLTAGRHAATLDAARLPAGVYVGRLRAGEQTASLRLTVIR